MDLLKFGKGLMIIGFVIAIASGALFGLQPSKDDIESDISIKAEDTAEEISRVKGMKAKASIGLGIGNFIAIMGVITFVSLRKPKEAGSSK